MMPEKYSYSKIDTYKSCPFKYKLQYVDKNYVFVGSIATEFGTAIHETEEAVGKCFLENKPIDYVSIKNNLILKFAKIEAKYYNDYHTKDTKSDRTYKEKAYEYLQTGIYRLENFLKQNPNYRIIALEKKFSFEFDTEHTFTGAIDRIFFDESTGTYLLQDIKSWAVEADKNTITTPLQFVVYSLAIQQMYNCSENDIICQYDLPLVGIVQDAGTFGFMKRGLEKLNKLFESIKSQDYTPNPSPLCHWCNFCSTNTNAPEYVKLLCPYHSNWTREHPTFQNEME